MSVKLYYQKIRGNKIDYSRDQQRVEWLDYLDSFALFLTSLGIDIDYTEDPNEGVVFLDIESTDFFGDHNELFLSIIHKYKRIIVGTLNEPALGSGKGGLKKILKFLNKNPNVIVLTITDIQDPKLMHDRLIALPAFFTRVPSPLFNSVTVHSSSFQLNGKFNIYNHLVQRWAPEKFYTHYRLAENNLLETGTCSYRVPENIETLEEAKELLVQYFGKQATDNMATALKFLPSQHLMHDTKEWGILHRRWPRYVMSNSYFSLVTETGSLHPKDWYTVSEKTLYPVLNKHPTLTIGSCGWHEYMAGWGFEPITDLFDYSFDSVENYIDRVDQLVLANVSNFSQHKYIKNFTKIDKTVTHNRSLIANPNSKLFKKLRKEVIQLIERYYDL